MVHQTFKHNNNKKNKLSMTFNITNLIMLLRQSLLSLIFIRWLSYFLFYTILQETFQSKLTGDEISENDSSKCSVKISVEQ